VLGLSLHFLLSFKRYYFQKLYLFEIILDFIARFTQAKKRWKSCFLMLSMLFKKISADNFAFLAVLVRAINWDQSVWRTHQFPDWHHPAKNNKPSITFTSVKTRGYKYYHSVVSFLTYTLTICNPMWVKTLTYWLFQLVERRFEGHEMIR